MNPAAGIAGSLAALLLWGVPFVASALWVRRRFGGAVLAAVWLLASVGIALLQFRALAPATAPELERPPDARWAMAGVLFFMAATSSGAASLAVHRSASRGAPTSLVPDFLVPLLSFAAAHVAAVLLTTTVIAVLAERHFP